MPKKTKLLVCPRCHRTVNAEEFGQHLSSHKGKKRIQTGFQDKTIQQITQNDLPEILQFHFSPEMKKSISHFALNKPIKSGFSKNQMREKFESSLKDVNAEYTSLKVVETNEHTSIEVKFDERRDLTLTYNPLSMRTYSEKAIDGLLLHEACHVSTLPTTDILVPDSNDEDMIRFFSNSVTNYDEYLAHVKLVNYFRNDPRFEGLKEQQIQLFSNFGTIANATKSVALKLRDSGINIEKFQIQVLEQLNAIVYDSLFFFVANDNSFKNWCDENSLQELIVFVEWIFKDFEHIRSLNLPHRETRHKVMASANFSMSVDPITLFFNKIVFADTTKSLHEIFIRENKDTDLAHMWEKRRQIYQT